MSVFEPMPSTPLGSCRSKSVWCEAHRVFTLMKESLETSYQQSGARLALSTFFLNIYVISIYFSCSCSAGKLIFEWQSMEKDSRMPQNGVVMASICRGLQYWPNFDPWLWHVEPQCWFECSLLHFSILFPALFSVNSCPLTPLAKRQNTKKCTMIFLYIFRYKTFWGNMNYF